MLFKEKIEHKDGVTVGGFPQVTFIGKDAGKFSGQLKPEEKNNPLENNFKKADYGILIFDKKRQAFRLEPLNRHIFFEKEKAVD